MSEYEAKVGFLSSDLKKYSSRLDRKQDLGQDNRGQLFEGYKIDPTVNGISRRLVQGVRMLQMKSSSGVNQEHLVVMWIGIWDAHGFRVLAQKLKKKAFC